VECFKFVNFNKFGMSKIGKQSIILPKGVTIEVDKGIVRVSGPKGTLQRPFPESVKITDKGKTIEDRGEVSVLSAVPALWGTWRAHIANMVKGVTEGFSKKLEIHGVGYKVQGEGENLTFALGFSHPVKVNVPKGVNAQVKDNGVILEGIDKEIIGQFASFLRSLRPPDPYKGKGIRYSGELIKLKPGKKAGVGSGV